MNRPVSVFMLTLLMVLFGAAAYRQLPQDLFPNLSKPVLLIESEYEGAASAEIEQNVTRKIEEKLGTVEGVTSMSSSSGNERSRVKLTFDWGTNMDLAAMDVRSKLDEIRGSLSGDAGEPVVLSGSSSSGAVIVFNVASNPESPNPVPPDALREWVEKTIKPRLDRVNGVASVIVRGGKEYEVSVRVVPEKLRAMGLSILDVRDALNRENISQRGGQLTEGDSQFLIRTRGAVSLESLPQLIVSRPGEAIRRLSDVAEVSPAKVEKRLNSLARMRNRGTSVAVPSVEISVFKKSGGNSVEVCRVAREVKTQVLFDLAEGEGNVAPLQMSVIYDESVFINESLEMVRSNGLTGLILASVILLVFLRRLQSTFVVVVAMPVSVVATFSLFYAGNISVNIFSMAGLTLAVGMVVDNAIVVTEAIFHRMEHERRIKKAVTEAIAEIGPAVWASTLTTIAVFLPIVFVPGIAGQIFRDLSWVIIFTLFFSMIVAFTLIPMLISKVMNANVALFDWLNRAVDILLWPIVRIASLGAKAYRMVLETVTRSIPVRVLVVLVMALAFAVTIGKLPSTEFFPESKVESYELSIIPRAGQTLAAVNQAVQTLEDGLGQLGTLDYYSLSVSPREVSIISSFDKEQVARGEVRPLRELQPVVELLESEPVLRDTFLDHRLISLNPLQNLLGSSGGDIVLRVSGPDLKVIERILGGVDGGEGLLGELSDQRTALGITSVGQLPGGMPERILRIKREAAADRGITLGDIADQVEAAVSGIEANDIEVGDRNLDIRLSSVANTSSREALLDLDIFSSGTGMIWKLGEVASVESRMGPQLINREERERTVTVPIFIDRETTSLGDVVSRLDRPEGPVRAAVEPFLEAGYRVFLGGASEDMNRSQSYLLYAFLVAIVLVYMIMASQFENLVHPFTIMFTVPLSLIGAVMGLNLSGEAISLTAMIGIIMLAGIVVNNGIILVDYINILRARGQSRDEAILEAGGTRLRPILMTALTTVLGMLPLALGIGTGAELYRPLAIVIVWGLWFSTGLTLIFIPAIYCLLDDLTDLAGLISFRIGMWVGRS